MEKEKNTKTLMILMIICVCLSITTLGIVIYDRFIRKEPEHAVLKPIMVDNQSSENNVANNNIKKFSKLDKITLSENNKTITVNDKNVTLKVIDDGLFINNKKSNEIYSSNFVYVTDYFFITVDYGQGGEMLEFYDKDGAKISTNNHDQYNNLRIENGNLVAEKSSNFECIEDESTTCDYSTAKVQFIYDGISITVKEI